MGGHTYLPNGFIERLIVALMPHSQSYTHEDPSVYLDFPQPSEFDAKGKVVVVIKVWNGEEQALVLVSSNGKGVACSVKMLGPGDWKSFASYVIAKASEVNAEFFREGLSLQPSREIGAGATLVPHDQAVTRSINLPEATEGAAETKHSSPDVEADKSPQAPLHTFLLETCKIKSESATIIHQNLEEEEFVEIQHLIDFLVEEGEGAFKELLKEAGCKRGSISSIIRCLKASEELSAAKKKDERDARTEQEQKERERKPFVLMITGGEDLNTSEETKLISNAFAGDKRKALLLDENNVASMQKSLSENRDIACVHFALHGAFSRGKHTLAMKTSKENDDWRTPEEVGEIINTSQADVESIVLNVCQGAKSASDFIGGAKYVIGWKTDVDDSAAVQFSEQFYTSIKDGDSVIFAYFHALSNLANIYDWQIDMDPSSVEDKKALRDRQEEKRRANLKIAGTPAIFKKSEGGDLEEIKECPKKVKKKVEEKRRSTYGKAQIMEKLDNLEKTMVNQTEDIKETMIKETNKVVAAVEKSMDTVMTFMFDLSEFDVPRSFVILPYELKKTETQGEEGEAKKITLSAASEGIKKADRWMTKLTSVINAVSSDVAMVHKDAAKKVEEMFAEFKSEKMYLYLVDEVTCNPVVGPDYPIVITAASEKAKKMLPLMTVGLNTLCLANKAAGLARCFGLPAPRLMTTEMQGTAEKFVKSVAEKSSVEGFDVVQSAIDEGFADKLGEAKGGEPEKKKLRGEKLREFKNFLEEHDANGSFAGLSREIRDKEVVWTLGKGSAGTASPVRSLRTDEDEGDVAVTDDKSMDVDKLCEVASSTSLNVDSTVLKAKQKPKEGGDKDEKTLAAPPPIPPPPAKLLTDGDDDDDDAKLAHKPRATSVSASFLLTGWLTKLPPRASSSSAGGGAGKKMKRQLLSSLGLAKAKRRFCVLAPNNGDYDMLYYVDETRGELKGTIKEVGWLTNLKVEGRRLTFTCDGRTWEFEGEVGGWEDALGKLRRG